ncbi:MAG TPA: ATP-binding cassette domain-containing protein [Jatrophihabitans sp.]|jgi:ABC-type multidrug transport system ATPase subunit|nr:ATP-binding cassette domain-containing protein [Jatrophihabitans sp.]
MGQTGAVLSATGVGVRGRQGRWLFRDISVELRAGEIIRVVGSAGSGVSTLLQVLAGIRAPNRGSLRVRAPSVGYVPQQFPETLNMSPQAYLSWVGRIRGIRPDVRQARITELCRTFELGSAADQRLVAVTGNRDQVARRLSIMQALLDEPALLVLDNAWLAADGHLRDTLARRVIALADAGCLVVYSGFAPALRASRFLTLSGGRLQASEFDPTSHQPHMRFELTGNGIELAGLPGVLEQHQHPAGLVLTVQPEHSDEVALRVLQGGWSIRRVEPRR